MALPKGRMYEQIVSLLSGAGIRITESSRGYRPRISLSGCSAKILKPRNVISMLTAGARDVGFAGCDWIRETGADLVQLLDTGLNPVRLVVATPEQFLVNGNLPDRHLVIATEYPNIAAEWIANRNLDASVLPTFGATEVFPPEDADCILDNTATGSTLRANGLVIIDEVMTSSTQMYASGEALENDQIKAKLDDLVMLLESVLLARQRVMMDLNAPRAELDAICEMLPSMREPTVSPLSDNDWVAVRAAIPRDRLVELIPRLKSAGACDIVTSPAAQIIP